MLEFNEKDPKIILNVKSTVEIRTNGPPSNYIKNFLKTPTQVVFAPTDKEEVRRVFQWVSTLFNLDSVASSSGLDPILEVSKLIKGKKGIHGFDQRNLESINEKPQVSGEIFVQRILPLEISYGFVFLTNKNFYFQALQSDGQTPIQRIRLKSITLIYKRRYVLKETALEFFVQGQKGSIYINFTDTATRDEVYTKIRENVPDIASEESIAKLTGQWQRKEITNYDYILALNQAAQRSFSDLSQYPIFPWTLIQFDKDKIDLNDESNYRDLSKPIGALNPDRLMKYKERMKDMAHPQFLYGTHYSTPGYVIGYLLRNHPLYMIKLGGGKFDRSDRLFFSIQNDWRVIVGLR